MNAVDAGVPFDLIDRPAQVAEVVAAESGWMPTWERVVGRAWWGLMPALILLPWLPPAGLACLAAGAALLSRLLPTLVAPRLHQDSSSAAVRRVREQLLTAYVVTGVTVVAALARAAPDPRCLVVGVIAAVLVALQHRSASVTPWRAVAIDLVERLAIAGLLPVLALATVEWWR